jgi:HAD superfamily hydrolase (TIGR01549 family)
VGETLIDESRLWGLWADFLHVPRLIFFSTLVTLIERREHHRRIFELFSPGFDVDDLRRARQRAGSAPDVFDAQDLYPDVHPCLSELRAAGYRLGVAANQPSSTEQAIDALGFSFDFVYTSESWGVEKPSPDFYARLIASCEQEPSEIAYVGDRVDNDIVPAAAAGLVTVFLSRGLWGEVHASWPEASIASARLETLAELPAALSRL